MGGRLEISQGFEPTAHSGNVSSFSFDKRQNLVGVMNWKSPCILPSTEVSKIKINLKQLGTNKKYFPYLSRTVDAKKCQGKIMPQLHVMQLLMQGCMMMGEDWVH